MSRVVTVASVSDRPPSPSPEQPHAVLDHAAHMVWRAQRSGANIVCFPEIYPHLHLGKPAACAEEVPGPTCERMMAEARSRGLYIVWPLWQRDAEGLHNASVLIDPRGQIVGIYHKMHPTIGEIEDGVIPGTEPRVFETDFGRIGLCICFDLNFRDVMAGLAANGAEIIFFSSMYRGGLQLQAWAYELGVYIVSSITGERGRIVDLTGQVLKTSTYEGLIAHPLNLERRLLHMDGNWEKMDRMLEEYGPDVRFEFITEEGCYVVSSERPGLRIDEVIARFELEGRSDYFARSNAVRTAALRAHVGGRA